MNYEKLRKGVNNIDIQTLREGGGGSTHCPLRNMGIFFVTKNRKWADNQALEFVVLFYTLFF